MLLMRQHTAKEVSVNRCVISSAVRLWGRLTLVLVWDRAWLLGADRRRKLVPADEAPADFSGLRTHSLPRPGAGLRLPPEGTVPVNWADVPDVKGCRFAEQDALANPVAFNFESLTRGAELYNRYCVTCHGGDGGGDGPVAGPPFGKGPFGLVLPIGGADERGQRSSPTATSTRRLLARAGSHALLPADPSRGSLERRELRAPVEWPGRSPVSSGPSVIEKARPGRLPQPLTAILRGLLVVGAGGLCLRC